MPNQKITKKQLEKEIAALETYQKGKLQKFIDEKKGLLDYMTTNNLKTVPGGTPPPNPPGSQR